MVMPGDNVNVSIEVFSPIAMESGSRFTVREGGKTVATGLVTEVLD
jgi:elongation factor Tu